MFKAPQLKPAPRDEADESLHEAAAADRGSAGFDLDGFLDLGGAVQARGELNGDDAHAWAARGVDGASSSLPHADAIQRSFGHHDVSGIRASVGGAAAEASSALGAHAYATGDRVAFAQSPDLHLAAHEAAHVVQQRGGVRLADGLGRPGDLYEQHADAVADLVVRGESAETLLDTMSHRGSAGGAAVQGKALQLAPDPGGAAVGAFVPAQDPDAPTCAQGTDPMAPEACAHPSVVDCTRGRILAAYTSFAAACQHNASAMEKLAKSKSEWTALLIDVSMGFLIPGLGTAVSKAAAELGKKMPALASTAAMVTSDMVKATVTGATKTICQTTKTNAKPLFGDSAIDKYLEDLVVLIDVAFQTLRENLPSYTNKQVLEIAMAFDANVTNPATYSAQIAEQLKRFTSQVESQGIDDHTDYDPGDPSGVPPTTTHSERIAALVLRPASVPATGPSSEHALAIVQRVEVPSARFDPGWQFIEWVSPEMVELASDRTKSITGAPPEIIAKPLVHGLPTQ